MAVHVIDTSDVINVSSIPKQGIRLGGEEITIDDRGQSQIVYNGICKRQSDLILALCIEFICIDFHTVMENSVII